MNTCTTCHSEYSIPVLSHECYNLGFPSFDFRSEIKPVSIALQQLTDYLAKMQNIAEAIISLFFDILGVPCSTDLFNQAVFNHYGECSFHRGWTHIGQNIANFLFGNRQKTV